MLGVDQHLHIGLDERDLTFAMKFIDSFDEIVFTSHAIRRGSERKIPVSLEDIKNTRAATRAEFALFRIDNERDPAGLRHKKKSRHKSGIIDRFHLRVSRDGMSWYVTAKDARNPKVLVVITCHKALHVPVRNQRIDQCPQKNTALSPKKNTGLTKRTKRGSTRQ